MSADPLLTGDIMIRMRWSLAFAAALASWGVTPGFAQEQPSLPLSAFVDSAGLHRALLGAPPAPPGTPERMLFMVRYDSTGALKDVRALVRHPLPGGYDSAMVTLLRAHLVPRLMVRRATGETLWLRGGSEPRIAVAKGREVQPTLTNVGALQRTMEAATKRLLASHPELDGYETTRNVAFSIGEGGVPVGEITFRGGGNPAIEREIAGIVRSMRFRPATIEGVPVAVLVELPITLTFRR